MNCKRRLWSTSRCCKKEKQSTFINSIIQFQPSSMALSNESMVNKNNGKEEEKSGKKKGTLINSIILPPTIFIIIIIFGLTLHARTKSACLPPTIFIIIIIIWLNTTCQNQKRMPTSHYLIIQKIRSKLWI